VKCNEQAERQQRKAKPQYGKLSIVGGKEAALKSMGIMVLSDVKDWNGIGGMIRVQNICAAIIPLWKARLAWL
jgi:hypothetical protein